MHSILEDELRFSASLVMSGEEVVPRFRIEVPGEPGFMLFVPLPEDLEQRQWRLQLVSAFMAWKGADAFVMSSELIEPDAVLSVAVSRRETFAALRMITRTPLDVGPVLYLARDQIGDEIPALLSAKTSRVSEAMLKDLQRVFGLQGAFKVERLH